MGRNNATPDCGDVGESMMAWIAGVCSERAAHYHRLARHADDRNNIDLLAWGRKHLPDHFSRPPSRMHLWLAEQLDAASNSRGTKLNVLGPRGAAKSTVGTLAFPLREALEGRESYIWIISDTKHQACAHLENIKAELIENRRLAEAYPRAAGRGRVWGGNSIVLRNGVAIEAFGTGQRLRGRRRRQHRPTLIVCDDLQNDGHILSSLQREHSRDWFHGTLMKAGTSRTNIINLATALHRDALAMQLHATPGWTSRLFQAIAQWPANTALWREWETIYTKSVTCNEQEREKGTGGQGKIGEPHLSPSPTTAARLFYEQHRPEMDAGAILLWPEVEDLYALMCMRVESGRTAFEREKQNSPINPDLCEWPESYFDESIWFDAWPANLTIKTMALDPSKGVDSHRGDYSALVALGVDRQGILYVDADLARRPTPEMVAEAVEWHCRFQPDVFGVEANQFQDLLSSEFETAFRRRNILSARPLPIDNRIPKPVRIRRLGPYLSQHRLRFKSNSPATKLLVEQLQQFPLASHDDGPDALEMALRLATEALNGRAFNDGLGGRLCVS